jgi:hypothetical protein
MRLASGTRFPYRSQMVAFMRVESGEIEQISLDEAIEAARVGISVYGAWPGEWSQDVFRCDDILEWADSLDGRNRPGQPTLRARCRECRQVAPLTRRGEFYRNHRCVKDCLESNGPWWDALKNYDKEVAE